MSGLEKWTVVFADRTLAAGYGPLSGDHFTSPLRRFALAQTHLSHARAVATQPLFSSWLAVVASKPGISVRKNACEQSWCIATNIAVAMSCAQSLNSDARPVR